MLKGKFCFDKVQQQQQQQKSINMGRLGGVYVLVGHRQRRSSLDVSVASKEKLDDSRGA